MDEKMNKSGIYMIRNTVNGKVYVGQTANFKKRWSIHKNKLQKGDHENMHLQASWNKHGKESFEFIVLEECECKNETLNSNEQKWIDKLCNNANGYYNMCPVAGSVRSHKWSVEQCLEQSRRRKAYFSNNTEATVAMSERAKSYYKEHPEVLVAMAERSNVYWADHEARAEQSKRRKAYFSANPEAGVDGGTKSKAYYENNPEARSAMSAIKKAFYAANPKAGAEQSKRHIAYYESNPQARSTMSKKIIILWKDPKYRAKQEAIQSSTKKAMWKNPDYRAAITIARKSDWADPIKRAKQLIACATGHAKKAGRQFSYINNQVV